MNGLVVICISCEIKWGCIFKINLVFIVINLNLY